MPNRCFQLRLCSTQQANGGLLMMKVAVTMRIVRVARCFRSLGMKSWDLLRETTEITKLINTKSVGIPRVKQYRMLWNLENTVSHGSS